MGHPIRYAVTVKYKEVAWEKVEGDIDNIKESNETYTHIVKEERRKWIWEVHMSSIHHVGNGGGVHNRVCIEKKIHLWYWTGQAQ